MKKELFKIPATYTEFKGNFPPPNPLESPKNRRTPEQRMADSLEDIGKKLSHIEDWLGELVTYLKRK